MALRALARGPAPGERLRWWLLRTARNAVVDYYRRHRPSAPLPDDLAEEGAAQDEEFERLLSTCVRPLLAELPPTYRTALEKVELKGLDQSSLAREEGLSPSGARTRVQRGRALFRRRLEQCCPVKVDGAGRIAGVEWSPCPSGDPAEGSSGTPRSCPP